jgi:hypothetical protein
MDVVDRQCDPKEEEDQDRPGRWVLTPISVCVEENSGGDNRGDREGGEELRVRDVAHARADRNLHYSLSINDHSASRYAFSRMRTRLPISLAALAIPGFTPGATSSAEGGAASPLIACATARGNGVFYRTAPTFCTIFVPGGSFGRGVNLSGLRWRNWDGASVSATCFEKGFACRTPKSRSASSPAG